MSEYTIASHEVDTLGNETTEYVWESGFRKVTAIADCESGYYETEELAYLAGIEHLKRCRALLHDQHKVIGLSDSGYFTMEAVS